MSGFAVGYGEPNKQDVERMLKTISHRGPACQGFAVWFLVPESTNNVDSGRKPRGSFVYLKKVLEMPAVWIQALIIICAYVCFRIIDYYTRFAAQGFGMDEVSAASIAAVSLWVRPFAAVGAGLLGDRFRSSTMCAVCFVSIGIGYLSFIFSSPGTVSHWMIYVNVVATCAGAFGLRGLYHALFAEGQVPRYLTGTAVGFVSLVGFTPDMFVPISVGHLLGEGPGFVEFQHVFYFALSFAVVGFFLSIAFRCMTRTTRL